MNLSSSVTCHRSGKCYPFISKNTKKENKPNQTFFKVRSGENRLQHKTPRQLLNPKYLTYSHEKWLEPTLEPTCRKQTKLSLFPSACWTKKLKNASAFLKNHFFGWGGVFPNLFKSIKALDVWNTRAATFDFLGNLPPQFGLYLDEICSAGGPDSGHDAVLLSERSVQMVLCIFNHQSWQHLFAQIKQTRDFLKGQGLRVFKAWLLLCEDKCFCEASQHLFLVVVFQDQSRFSQERPKHCIDFSISTPTFTGEEDRKDPEDPSGRSPDPAGENHHHEWTVKELVLKRKLGHSLSTVSSKPSSISIHHLLPPHQWVSKPFSFMWLCHTPHPLS